MLRNLVTRVTVQYSTILNMFVISMFCLLTLVKQQGVDQTIIDRSIISQVFSDGKPSASTNPVKFRDVSEEILKSGIIRIAGLYACA